MLRKSKYYLENRDRTPKFVIKKLFEHFLTMQRYLNVNCHKWYILGIKLKKY